MEPELTDEGPNAPDPPAASGILDAADVRFLLPAPIRSASVVRPAPVLEAALAAGIAAGGGHALLAGVLPTPGASVLVRRYGFDMAAVVSASQQCA